MKIVRISAIWCSSCIVTYNSWCSIKKKYPNIEFKEIDYDMDDIEPYQVKEILPVTIFYKDQKEVFRIEGEYKEQDIERVIKNEKMDS
jgi:thiol-disulfide isomerase/thioredoxin